MNTSVGQISATSLSHPGPFLTLVCSSRIGSQRCSHAFNPSSGAHNATLLNNQKEDKPDAIYKGRPIDTNLTTSPIAICHAIFATFQRKMSMPWTSSISAIQGLAAFPPNACSAIRQAISELRKHNFIFGDLRVPDIILREDGSVARIDFDWCGREGEATYPPDINLDLAIGTPWWKDSA